MVRYQKNYLCKRRDGLKKMGITGRLLCIVPRDPIYLFWAERAKKCKIAFSLVMTNSEEPSWQVFNKSLFQIMLLYCSRNTKLCYRTDIDPHLYFLISVTLDKLHNMSFNLLINKVGLEIYSSLEIVK